MLKFIYSEKDTKILWYHHLRFHYVVMVKSTVEILQNFVSFSEYINFTYYRTRRLTEWVVSASPGTTTLGWTKKITSTLFFVKVPRYFCFGIKKNRFTLFLNKYARQLRVQEINRIFTIGSLNIWHISALLVFRKQ